MREIYIIKIGSSTLVSKSRTPNKLRIAHIADQLKILKKFNVDVVLVISGAVACGSRFINLDIENIKLRQIAAGIGQVCLSSVFNKEFSKKGLENYMLKMQVSEKSCGIVFILNCGGNRCLQQLKKKERLRK